MSDKPACRAIDDYNTIPLFATDQNEVYVSGSPSAARVKSCEPHPALDCLLSREYNLVQLVFENSFEM